jgi:F0F1-type ATP synthase assembly protein I
MINIFKVFLIFFGGILIGFGIGLIIGKNLLFTDTAFWSVAISSLILGGFLMAFGLAIVRRKKEPKEEIIEKEESNNLQNPANINL